MNNQAKKGSENTNKPGSYEDGGSFKLIAEQIVGTNGLTTEAVDSPDAGQVKNNDSKEISDARTDNHTKRSAIKAF